MKLRKAELDRLVAVANEQHDSAEDFVTAIIKEYNALRVRGYIYACMIIAGIPLAVGPFSTRNQAERAVAKLGADRCWIVAGWTPEGWSERLDEVNKEPAPFKLNADEERKRDRQFWQKVSQIRNGEVTALTVTGKNGTGIKELSW